MTIQYFSSLDKTGPLFADLCFKKNKRPKPMVVVMHGYGGSREAVKMDISDLADKNVFAIAPDMRGLGNSAGKWDCYGLSHLDILDAIGYVIKHFPDDIDTSNINIVGYSGGGGDALACVVRFPDVFKTAVSFFGISNLAFWYNSQARLDCNDITLKLLGGPPEELPEIYEARNFIDAACNNGNTRIHLFWDEEEIDCPPIMMEKYINTSKSCGHKNIITHISHRSDEYRWKHGYRNSTPDLKTADDIFLEGILTNKTIKPSPPLHGRLVVPGYLITNQFSVFVEDGKKGKITIECDLTKDPMDIQIIENKNNYKCTICRGSPLWKERAVN